MFAIGHFALGYLVGKGSSKALNAKLNLPLLFVASVLPDIDLLLQGVDQTLFMHRGPTHSIITFTIFMVPLIIIFGKNAVPYYLALLSHSLVGDIPTGGIEMLWPISQDWYGSNIIAVGGLADVVSEMILFAAATSIMFKAGDLKRLLEPKTKNWVLVLAGAAVIGPIFEISQGSDAALPLLLIPASLFWVALFLFSIVRDFATKKRKESVKKEYWDKFCLSS